MERKEAIVYLKEIASSSKSMSPNQIFLEESPSKKSKGFRIHIKGQIENVDKTMVRAAAAKHNLSVDEGKNELIIYRHNGSSKEIEELA